MIVGNLDVQEHWRHRLAPERPAAMPRMPVLRAISSVATLLRVLADPDEELWTPLPVDPARLPAFDGIAPVRLVAGRRPRQARLWWGEPTTVAARCDHRAFGLAIQHELGCVLPGAAMVRDLSALEARDANVAWVLKAPLSAAGRDRLVGTGPPDRATRQAARNLLEAHGELLLEPWLERTADYGCDGSVSDDGTAAVATLHHQIVDERGRFSGILLDAVPRADARIVERTFRAVASRLHDAGFRGPFGIDAWRAGDLLQPLGEINARLTIGHLARAWADRLGIGRARFVAGREAAPPGAVVLLEPGAEDPTCAWLQEL